MNSKISDKDKKDWKNFILSKDEISNKDLSILKYSVPEFIKSNLNLMKKIKKIDETSIDDKKSGVFYIYLKTI